MEAEEGEEEELEDRGGSLTKGGAGGRRAYTCSYITVSH